MLTIIFIENNTDLSRNPSDSKLTNVLRRLVLKESRVGVFMTSDLVDLQSRPCEAITYMTLILSTAYE